MSAAQQTEVAAHTPGPWFVDRRSMGEENAPEILGDRGTFTVAIVEIASDTAIAAQDRANIALICAAPDLLAAAKDAQCSCSLKQRESGHLVGCWMPALTEAIWKARP